VESFEPCAHGKLKASTAIRAPDAVERADRWKALTVDEFQAIVENLQAIVENIRSIVENLEERDARHLLGSPRRDPETPRWPTSSQAAAAARCSKSSSDRGILDHSPKKRGRYWRPLCGAQISRGLVYRKYPDPVSPSNALDAGRTPSKIQARCCMLRITSRSTRICYPFNSLSWCGDVVLRRFARVRSQQASGGTWCSYWTKKSRQV
jgi:hypothetical protein